MSVHSVEDDSEVDAYCYKGKQEAPYCGY